MRVKSVSINRFRGYAQPVEVEVADLLVLVGRNDIGKSTILEALDCFFNEGKGSIKIDKSDINKSCLANGEDTIEIGVEFTDLPSRIIIDASNETSLEAEYLLTQSGTLHVIKRYPNAGKERVFIRARHPVNPECSDLLQKKHAELKKLVEDAGLHCEDKSKNAELRRSLWQGPSVLSLEECEIEVTKIDAKAIWEQLKAHMPQFSLFQSDRKNSDSDDEVQDPMRVAVKEIIGDARIQEDLARVAETVKKRLDQVANRTLDKLREMNPAIASSLNPQLPDTASLKWTDVFKSVSITSDDEIPINKRGSGVKRLVLISFFRAEAERRRNDADLPDIIYAIEEPETSQHPEHQRALIDALTALSQTKNTQVLLTTHSPEVVKRLGFESIRLVSDSSGNRIAPVLVHELPYPSLNEINFVAFGEATPEYHNELYGFIQHKGQLGAYKHGKPLVAYNRLRPGGSVTKEQIIMTEYVRHQIHHPENTENTPYSPADLRSSIEMMRAFLQGGTQP